ncbi:MAG: carbohydrate kinase family protein [Patescibacteria group bacterium]|jgi:sugar/nucleoside kinase (ribokinase family)
MYDVITIGSAFQDLYLFSKNFRIIKDRQSPSGEDECFALGSKIEVETILREIGGGGTNTAATFARQGLKVACLAKIGDDAAGEEIIKTLKKYNIDSSLMITDKDQPTALGIFFLAKTGERTILVYRGASADFQAKQIPWLKLKSNWYYVSSLGGNLQVLEKIIAHAKRHGAKVALNPGKTELAKKTRLLLSLRKAQVVLLNREEAEMFFGLSGQALLKKVSKVTQGWFVITDGEHGSWALSPKSAWKVQIRPVKAMDTTGAGDAFGSGFVAGLIKSPNDLSYALKLGSTNAAAEVKLIGAKNGLITSRTPLIANLKVQRLRI